MNQVENPVAEMETDGMENLPSKAFSKEQKDDIFRTHRMPCPVCGLTGGPTFLGSGKYHISVTFQGLRIPSDHLPECMEKAETAYFYVSGKMDDHQMSQYVHTAEHGDCSHPHCVARRLWKVQS